MFCISKLLKDIIANSIVSQSYVIEIFWELLKICFIHYWRKHRGETTVNPKQAHQLKENHWTRIPNHLSAPKVTLQLLHISMLQYCDACSYHTGRKMECTGVYTIWIIGSIVNNMSVFIRKIHFWFHFPKTTRYQRRNIDTSFAAKTPFKLTADPTDRNFTVSRANQ